MTDSSPSQFSHPAWMNAVSYELFGHLTLPKVVEPFTAFYLLQSRFPFPHAATSTSPLTPCPLPCCSAQPTIEQAKAFLTGIAKPILLRSVPQEHPVMKALSNAARHEHVLQSWQRAGLNVTGSFENWLSENFDHKRRKEFKRLKARLSEQGVLRLEALELNGKLEDHITAFLTLEASGWKGKRGTAIGNDESLVKALRAGLQAMHELGKLRFWTLWLDKTPVASLFALVGGGQAVLGKIGFDENYAKYSPGVLLIIEATEALFADPSVEMADANAIPGHPMIDRIWRDRIACMDVLIAGDTVSPLTFKIVSSFHGTKDATRKFLKRIYLSVTGRRRS